MRRGESDEPSSDRGSQNVDEAAGNAELARGRACYLGRAWLDAYRSLACADENCSLGGEDLELLAVAAYLIGRDEDYLDALDRAHRAHLGAGEVLRAARCAYWISLRLLFRGESARASGWFGRAQRLLDGLGQDCAERGYLLVSVVQQQLAAGEREAAHVSAASAAEIGERFADGDLVAIARHLQGRVRVEQGKIEEGLALLDEAMVAVIAGELSPIVTGLLYCSVIGCCQEVFAHRRAREWTFALARWCEEQPDMVAFVGQCRVHRAEIMQRYGAWSEAIEEARRACERSRDINRRAAAEAFYQEAEVHRLKGELAEAELAYRNASQWGREPQPGMALLWLGQGRADAAAAAIRRVVSATTDRLRRTSLLSACCEIMLAAGEVEEARSAARELEELADSLAIDVVGAMAGHARGAVALADGDARVAVVSLRRAGQVWQEVGAPYEAARVRLLIGLACQALGDEESGRLELDGARAELERLGAAPEVARIDALVGGPPPVRPHGLTPRELEVLRLVAAGKTNKAIAGQLCLSEKTVDRHVSNIFVKLDVPSRAAATAFAYQHKLV